MECIYDIILHIECTVSEYASREVVLNVHNLAMVIRLIAPLVNCIIGSTGDLKIPLQDDLSILHCQPTPRIPCGGSI